MTPLGPPLVSSTAIVERGVYLGDGVRVWAMATIHEGARLEDGVSVGELTYVGKNTHVGSGTRIGAQVHITDHMTIGRNCFIAPMAIFCNDRYPEAGSTDWVREDPVVEDDVSVGVNATILPGVRLGRGCVIGAGSVVTKDVPPYETWVGNPAHPTRKVDY